jgi:outer membrane receptor protein involved in Fe transport
VTDRKVLGPFRKLLPCLAAALGLALAAPDPTFAQATTGTLSGEAVDESGGVLPGATVEAVHVPTGTRYTAVTDEGGRFNIINVRVGPYSVSVSLGGFKTQERKDVNVRLGEERALTFKMGLETVSETVEVTADAAAVFNPSNTGPVSNVSQEAIQNLPTIGRGLDDFARLNPYFSSVAIGGTNTNALSVAGRNNRYNNIQIDGAVNNDLFGLAASGAPGGQADAQPVSLDAIQEIQLLVAPYDVRQGGFSGGGLNAITKSGTNAYAGTLYWFTRNQDFVGNGPDDREFGIFDDDTFGASFGGPIKKDKAFFFLNADLQRRKTPNGFSINGSSGQNFGHQAEAERFRSILRNRYQYDPGEFNEEFIRTTDNDKIFGRLDFNLSSRHQLTLRHNYIDGINDIYGTGNSSTRFNFPDAPYQFNSKTNSTVAQLNSTFGKGFNELRITYQRVREFRGHATNFPQVTVRLPDGANLVAGTEQFSAANALDQDIIELTDDYTFTRGNHTLTVGTHNEFFKFANLFIRDNFGAYTFGSLDLLDQGFAQQFDYSFSATADPQQKARFRVNQFGFYAGDLWRVNPRLTLTLGIRVDKPFFPTKPTANPVSEANFGFRTDVVPNPTMFSPRIGFNFDVSGDGKRQIRGGGGLFAGRTPYVWLSNQYGNTGNEFTRIGAAFNANNRIPFVSNPLGQPTRVTGATAGAFTNEIDVVDPDYDFPQVIRGNLAFDQDLGLWGLVATVEFLGSTTLKDIDYENLIRVPGTATLFDGRPIFVRRVASLSDVILLTTTNGGSQWSLSGKVERPFKNGLYASASYIYGRAKSVNDGTSSQALSNWRFVYVPGDINNPPVADSNFDVAHRISAAVSYDLKVFGGASAVLSLFYNGQSGRPFSVLFNTDVNADGTIGNDLIFVPANVNDVAVTNGTPAQLEAFIAADEGLSANRGNILPRNASRAPWTNTFDFRAAVGVPWGKRRFEVTVDVLNLINLVSSEDGRVQFTANQNISPIQFGGINAAGRPVYNIATLASPTFQKFLTDDLRSRWQAQLGFRVRF